MKTFVALTLHWPDTGRRSPPFATLAILKVHTQWKDLCWWDQTRNVWVYLSTLPA